MDEKKRFLITWSDGYERFATFEELKEFCGHRGISNKAYMYQDKHYSSEDKMYRIDSAGFGQYRNITVIYQPEIISVSVYLESVKPDYDELKDGENMTEIEIPKDMLFKWFKENILKNFKGDDTSVSDEGLFEEWLDEYTAEDTDTLYADMKQFITCLDK